ncbi:MAG: immunity protein Imm33 domain-containing protein [Chitinophagales bacterium]
MIQEQKQICQKYGAEYVESPLNEKVGISLEVLKGKVPIHGLRHSITESTTGWYIWAGEYSEKDDFFQPYCIKHLKKKCPWIMKYLGLAPSWRFLVTPDYEDVWQDKELL